MDGEAPEHFAWDLLDAPQGDHCAGTSVVGERQPPKQDDESLASEEVLVSDKTLSRDAKLSPDETPSLDEKLSPDEAPSPDEALSPDEAPAPHEALAPDEARISEQKPADHAAPELGPTGSPIFVSVPPVFRGERTISKICWADVGMPAEPGQYMTQYGLVEVGSDELSIWRSHPAAMFSVLLPSPYSSQNFARLGSFELRGPTGVFGDD